MKIYEINDLDSGENVGILSMLRICLNRNFTSIQDFYVHFKNSLDLF